MRMWLAIAPMMLVAAPAAAEWEFKVLEDPMTDAKRGIASIDGDQGALVVKCDRNGKGSLYFTVISKHYLGGISGRREREVKFRIDGGTVSSLTGWYDDRIALISDIKPSNAAGAILTGIMNSQKLVVQVTSFDYESHVIVFDTTGARSAIERAALACKDTNWTPAFHVGDTSVMIAPTVPPLNKTEAPLPAPDGDDPD